MEEPSICTSHDPEVTAMEVDDPDDESTGCRTSVDAGVQVAVPYRNVHVQTVPKTVDKGIGKVMHV